MAKDSLISRLCIIYQPLYVQILRMITMDTRDKDYDLDSSPAKSYGKDEWMTSIHINKLSSAGYKTRVF
jgi:hypothetical protein